MELTNPGYSKYMDHQDVAGLVTEMADKIDELEKQIEGLEEERDELKDTVESLKEENTCLEEQIQEMIDNGE
jgi:phage shock protein A